MVQCANSRCQKEIYGNGKFCRCKQYMFCDDHCYTTRPFRKEHKQICEDRHRLELKRKGEEKKLKRKTLKQKAVANQPRDQKGRFNNIPVEKELDPEEAKKEEERKKTQQLHSVTYERKENIIKACQSLQDVRKNWIIKATVIRNNKYSKADPVIYETPKAGVPGPSLTETVGGAANAQESDGEVFDLEEQHLEDVEGPNVQQMKPFCYICGKKIGSLRVDFSCNGKLEDGTKCLEGASHASCLNFQWTNVDKDIKNRLKNVYLCPTHIKRSEESDSNESDLEEGVEIREKLPPKPKKVATKVLYNTKTALTDLMPEDKRDVPMTRNEIHKLINIYIKSRSLEYVDDSTKPKVKKVRPDARLSLIFGNTDFAFRNTGSKKINQFIKRTNPIPEQNILPELEVINPVVEEDLVVGGANPELVVGKTNPNPVKETRRYQHLAQCSRDQPSSSRQLRGDVDHGAILERTRSAEQDSPPFDYGDDYETGWPLMTRDSVPADSDDSLAGIDDHTDTRERRRSSSTDSSSSRENTRTPKRYLKPANRRKKIVKTPARYPKSPKKSAAFSEGTNSGERSPPAVRSSDEETNTTAARGNSTNQEEQMCDQCGFLQFVKVLESTGCEFCNKE